MSTLLLKSQLLYSEENFTARPMDNNLKPCWNVIKSIWLKIFLSLCENQIFIVNRFALFFFFYIHIYPGVKYWRKQGTVTFMQFLEL